jgi:transcriptional regulator of acetoin/glycerol metabolism
LTHLAVTPQFEEGSRVFGEKPCPGNMDTTVEDPGQPAAERPRAGLVLLFGRVRGDRRCFVPGTDPLQLGREVDDAHDVQLEDPRASRRHAEIHWSELHARHWIRDLGSRNGVHLNGARVARELLKPGDVVRVGDTFFRYGVAPADPVWPGLSEAPLVGRSQSLRLSIERAIRVATCDAPVLIVGPTGSGKELVAGLIHRASGRSGPLVAVNCAALPAHLVESELFGHERGAFSGAEAARPGLFRCARGGTLFLDEVGELPVDMQAKLLRALDTRSIRPVGGATEAPVDIRVIAASNRDLAGEASEGVFRPDLYARLAELVVELDGLRDRPEDLEPLWRHFVAELGQGAVVEPSGAAFEAMALHSWPFNVRELRQLVRSALLLEPQGGELSVDDLPPSMRPPRPEPAAGPARPAAALVAPGETPSAGQLRRLVEEYGGSVKEIASFLGKDRKQIYRWLRRYHIEPDAYRRPSE